MQRVSGKDSSNNSGTAAGEPPARLGLVDLFEGWDDFSAPTSTPPRPANHRPQKPSAILVSSVMQLNPAALAVVMKHVYDLIKSGTLCNDSFAARTLSFVSLSSASMLQEATNMTRTYDDGNEARFFESTHQFAELLMRLSDITRPCKENQQPRGRASGVCH